MNKNIITIAASIALLVIAMFPLFLAGNLGSYASKQDKLIAPMEEAQFSKEFFAHLQARDLETVKSLLDPKAVDTTFPRKFEEIANIFPNETPKGIKLIGINTTNYNGVSTTNISSEYEFSSGWVLASAVLQKQGNNFRVLGFHLRPASDSLLHSTQFKFLGQDTKHYVAFAVAILLLLFNIYALAICIKMPIPKRKWLWIVFILVGFGKVEFNWLNGAFYFFGNYGDQNFSVDFLKFPVAGFSQILYQPFIITMTVPVGAIIFLLKRKKWVAR
jgi:hypothetical protein